MRADKSRLLILWPVSQRWRGEVLQLNDELLEEAWKILNSERVAWVGFYTRRCCEYLPRQFPDERFGRQDGKRQCLRRCPACFEGVANRFPRLGERSLCRSRAGVQESYIFRPRCTCSPFSEIWPRCRVRHDDKLASTASSAFDVLCANLIESRQGALNIAEDKTRSACFDLRIDASFRKHELDVFVVLDNDVCDARARGTEQACRGVEVLIEKSAVNGFDTSKLASV